MNGVLDDTQTSVTNRVTQGINQAFEQSPYLVAGKLTNAEETLSMQKKFFLIAFVLAALITTKCERTGQTYRDYLQRIGARFRTPKTS